MELSKRDRIDSIINKLKILHKQGIINKEIIHNFGKIAVESPERAEQRKKMIELSKSLLDASTIEEVVEKRNASGLFPRAGSIVVDKIKRNGLDSIKKSAEATIKQMEDEELFFETFKLGLEGELTREDLNNIINKALGEENGNN